ncbi:UNVERIFIED_CONTAM: hypothetical protein Sradi_7168800 [Sesamum radiatum]|uniref:Reverse transcriptase domain-containing protein n=1 Tax=Sesamum radiatum TaxID=300843 RepID=A0AAW2IU68_SESRA
MDIVYFTRRFGFHAIVSNATNNIWCFSKIDYEVQVIQDHDQFLHLKVSCGILPEDIFCTFIYAKCSRNPRRILWEELKTLSNHKTPWLVGGDFNAILHTEENMGGIINRLGPLEDFNDMILESGLTDAGFEGEPFTWTNKRVWRRLDRVLYSKDWTDLFNITRVTHLSRRLSDHHPLLITADRTENRWPSSFRFQQMWVSHQNFLETAKRCGVSLYMVLESTDVWEAVRDFFCGTPMPRSFTATSITLIPKVNSPQTWADYYPISLCNVSNKILSKLLYTKLAQALPHLISPSQSGFVPGRLLSDNILLAQEMIHQLDLRDNRGNLVIKLDMLKAYDRISWRFLCFVLAAMGFNSRFISLIRNAIENSWFTILVNGEPAGFFKSTRGLRQEDPLSPALFILAAEAFSRRLIHYS